MASALEQTIAQGHEAGYYGPNSPWYSKPALTLMYLKNAAKHAASSLGTDVQTLAHSMRGGVNPALTTAAMLGATAPFLGTESLAAKETPALAKMFIGPGATTYDIGKAALARMLKTSGKSPEDVWYATQTHIAPDAAAWQEISDKAAKVGLKYSTNVGGLPKLLSHPELFKAYPELKDVKVKIKIRPDMPAAEGAFYSSANKISINAPDAEAAKNALLHEVQHWVQSKEGWARGTDTAHLMRVQNIPYGEALTKYYNKLGEVQANLTGNFPDLPKAVRDILPPQYRIEQGMAGTKVDPKKIWW